MNCRSILVPIRGIEHDIHAIRSALKIARRFEAHVDVLFARASGESLAAAFAGYGMVPPPVGLVGQIQEGIQQQEAVASKLVERAAEEMAVAVVSHRDPAGRRPSVALMVEPGALFESVSRVGALHDLIVYEHEPQGVELEPFDDLVLQAALLGARRPCFLAPKVLRGAFPAQVAVGWSGSVEGAHAVTAALPFLAEAAAVHVIRVCAADAPPAGEQRLLDYLRWHKIPATVHRVHPAYGQTATALLTKATDLEAELLVLGGFTHGPIRQSLLGGVTRDVLRFAPMPVLMAH